MEENVVKRSEFVYTREQRFTKVSSSSSSCGCPSGGRINRKQSRQCRRNLAPGEQRLYCLHIKRNAEEGRSLPLSFILTVCFFSFFLHHHILSQAVLPPPPPPSPPASPLSELRFRPSFVLSPLVQSFQLSQVSTFFFSSTLSFF